MLKPLHDYVVLKKMKEQSTTMSGIILSSHKDDSKFAQVISIGSDVKNPDYKIEDKVLYKEFAATIIEYKNEEYILIKDEDIIAVSL